MFQVKYNGNKFEAEINMEDYDPSEVKVSLKDNLVTIKASQSKTEDEYGTFSKEMCRTVTIPQVKYRMQKDKMGWEDSCQKV